MKLQTQWKRLLIGGAAALALTGGTLWAVDNVSAASPAALLRQTGIQQMVGFGEHGRHGGPGDHGMMGNAHGMKGEQQQYLADALGITVEELDAAHTTVRNTLLDQAVADGTLTQGQADQIKAGERVRVPGLRMKGDPAQAEQREALLAGALGMTVEELDAAQLSARESALAAALANGEITQEQVDRMAARQALRTYVQETYGTERPDTTIAELIQEAVGAGAITQEQADLLSSGEGRMDRGGRGRFERGGRNGGRGHFDGRSQRGQGLPNPDGTEAQPNTNGVGGI